MGIIEENLENNLLSFLYLAFLFFSVRPFVRSGLFITAGTFFRCSAVLHLTPVSRPLSLVGVAASIPSSFATAADIHSNSEGLGIPTIHSQSGKNDCTGLRDPELMQHTQNTLLWSYLFRPSLHFLPSRSAYILCSSFNLNEHISLKMD